MTRLRLVLLLARWEFMRTFRWRDLLISLAISLGLIAVLGVAGRLVAATKARVQPMRLAVAGEAPFELPPATSDFEWIGHGPTAEADLDRLLSAGTLDGYLRFDSDAQGAIVGATDGARLDALRAALSAARRDARIRAHGLDERSLDDILMPFKLERRTVVAASDGAHQPGASTRSHLSARVAKIVAVALVVVMFIGIMSGTSHLFVGITSEKQSRVTEQIVAATPPQMWIDGKILGAAARSMLSLALLVVQCLLGVAVWAVLVKPGSISLLNAIEPGQVLAFALLALLGFSLWFCFFAAVAATINDPNTSSRGAFILLPVVAALFAVPIYLNPTGWLSIGLGLLPVTSPMALPMRMILADVAWWELPVAALALVGAIWMARRGAGKVFALGIMMHGKEPSWRDMVRAFRAG